jgi:hypothetical protein
MSLPASPLLEPNALKVQLSAAADGHDAIGNARRTGLAVLGLSAVTAVVGFGLLALQRGGYVQADPFIGSAGMIVFSVINAACGVSMLRQRNA